MQLSTPRHFRTKLSTPAGVAPPPITSRARTYFLPWIRISVIDFDLVDDSTQIGAAEGNRAVPDVLAHQAGEGGDLLFRDPGFRAQFGEGAVERCLTTHACALPAPSCRRRPVQAQRRPLQMGERLRAEAER